MVPTELLGEVLALVAAIIGATSAVLLRRAFSVKSVEPESAVTVYTLLLCALFIPYGLLTDIPTEPAVVWPFVAGGVLGLVGGGVTFYRGLRWIGAARAVPIRSSSPVLAPVFAALFLARPVTLLLIVGTLIVVSGAVLIVYETNASSTVAIQKSTMALGVVSTVVSAILFALYPVILRLGYDAGGTPWQALSIGGTAALLVVMVLSVRNPAFDPRPLRGPGKKYLLTGASSLVVALVLFLLSFSLAPVVAAIAIYGSLPFFTVVFSWLYLGDLESVTLPVVVGALFVVCGIALVMVA